MFCFCFAKSTKSEERGRRNTFDSRKILPTDSGEVPPTDIEQVPPTRVQDIPDSSNPWSRGSSNTVLTDKLIGQEVGLTVVEGYYVNVHQHYDLPRSDSEKKEKVKYPDLLRERKEIFIYSPNSTLYQLNIFYTFEFKLHFLLD